MPPKNAEKHKPEMGCEHCEHQRARNAVRINSKTMSLYWFEAPKGEMVSRCFKPIPRRPGNTRTRAHSLSDSGAAIWHCGITMPLFAVSVNQDWKKSTKYDIIC